MELVCVHIDSLMKTLIRRFTIVFGKDIVVDKYAKE